MILRIFCKSSDGLKTNCLWWGDCLSSFFSCLLFPWPVSILIMLFFSFVLFSPFFSVSQRYFFRFSDWPNFIALSHLFLFPYFFSLPHIFLILYVSVSDFSSSSFLFTMFILNWVFPASLLPCYWVFIMFFLKTIILPEHFGPDGVIKFTVIPFTREAFTNFIQI